MGIFDGIDEASTGVGRRYLDPGGTYIVKIKKCGEKSAAESFKGVPSFFVELEVVMSDINSCPAGTLASWSVTLKPDKVKRSMALANIKQFLAATIGVMTVFETPDPVTGVKPSTEAILSAATSKANPFAETLVGVRVSNLKTRDANDFSKHTWFPAK